MNPAHIPADALDQYLAEQEARFSDITPGAEKHIVWAGNRGRRSDYVIVYLHGFSATCQEIAPLCERLAEQLNANLFYTRLSGHGRGSEAMLDGSLERWQEDAREAHAIGRALGRRLIVIGNSTGATLATWLANDVRDENSIAALILLSPNFGLQHPLTRFLDWPLLGPLLLHTVLGKQRRWQPASERQARYWTYVYPSRCLIPMMRLVKQVARIPKQGLDVPVQVIYSPRDQVVDIRALMRSFSAFGGQHKELQAFLESEDPHQHILAGDILSPSTTSPVLRLIKRFIDKLDRPAHRA